MANALDAGGVFDKRLCIVGGKGGTGKSTIAAAIAQLSAFRGERTLLIAADGTAGAAGLLGVEPTYEPTALDDWLHVLRIDKRSSLTEFVRLQMGPLSRLAGPVAAAVGFVADAAPGVAELLLVGKYGHEARSGDWDRVVVDVASTGHLLGELSAPVSVRELAPVGRIAEETDWMIEMLGDTKFTGVINVTLAEELPVSETIEFAEALRDRTPARLSTVVVNRTRPQLYSRARRTEIDAVLADPPKRMTIGQRELLDAIEIGLDRTDVSVAVDAELRQAIGAAVPILHVPEFSADADLASVREAIADELSL